MRYKTITVHTAKQLSNLLKATEATTKSKRKGGCHENQDEGEGGTERPHSELKNNRNKSARSHTAGGFSSYT
jgi:IS5 family transposase